MPMLARPQHTGGEAFTACISRVRNNQLQARLVSVTTSVQAASEEFDTASTNNSLHLIQRETLVGGVVTTEEMTNVYSRGMARSGAPGRHVYDEIVNSSPQGRCPLCAHRIVTTLDHHLPKAYYPALAVTPLNLVPSCTDCNRAKQADFPETPDEAYLNPYYDDIDGHPWLTAVVIESIPAAVVFQVTAPVAWDAVLAARVKRHFETLGLDRLYGSEAAEELVHVRKQLVEMHAAGGMNIVRAELEWRAGDYEEVRPNGWRSATYRAWANNDWFCNGGFAPTG